MKAWVLTKILALLTTQEGFSLESTEETGVIIQDAFGFRYQVKVTVLGRNCVGAYVKEGSSLDFLEDRSYGA